MPEVLVLFIFFLFIATFIGALLIRKSKRSPSASFSRSNSAQERLSEIDELRKKNLITEAEYEAKRKAIVDSI